MSWFNCRVPVESVPAPRRKVIFVIRRSGWSKRSSDRLFSSILLWGPPDTGKTTLAMVIANQTKSHFETLSAVLAGKAELREVIDKALERRKPYQKKTILFVNQVLETLT